MKSPAQPVDHSGHSVSTRMRRISRRLMLPVALLLPALVLLLMASCSKQEMRSAEPNPPAERALDNGRFQVREAMVKHWQEIGTVIQGAVIEGYSFDQGYFLEVASMMSDVSAVVVPWPNQVTDQLTPTG